MQGIRVEGERCAEPPKVRRFTLSPRRFPHFRHPLQILLTERSPDAPYERTWAIHHRNLQAAPNEKMLAVDNAHIRGQISPGVPLVLRDCVIWRRGICSKVHWKIGMKLAAHLADKALGHSLLF